MNLFPQQRVVKYFFNNNLKKYNDLKTKLRKLNIKNNYEKKNET